MQRIAVFASGAGSNFQALVDAQTKGLFDLCEREKQSAEGTIRLLVTDKPECGAVQKARDAGIEVAEFLPKEFPSKSAYEQQVRTRLFEHKIDWIVLAGYMRLIGPDLLEAFRNRIINLHPSLLPAFPGKRAIEEAYEYGVKVTGVTVHLVDEGMDTGPILAQSVVQVKEDDTIESLTQRLHLEEHALLPATVRQVITSGFHIDGRTVRF